MLKAAERDTVKRTALLTLLSRSYLIVNHRPNSTAITTSDLERRLAAVWPQFIQCTFSQSRGDAAAGHDQYPSKSPSKVTGRLIHIQGNRQIQCTAFHGAQQTHTNQTFAAALRSCVEMLQRQFQRLHLFTAGADIVVKRTRDGEFTWNEMPPTKTAVEETHNRRKHYLIPEDQPCPFLIEIGVMNREGRVLAPKYHKFRQINRFLEIVDDVLPHLPTDRELQVVDFGSGKSYLTFALHHLLTQIRGRAARIVGVDRKADVIRDCSRIATELGCAGLSFQHGDIAQFGSVGHVDLMVSLHACDTATDAALAQAVRWRTPVILAVPCCQHELAASFQPDLALESLAVHGILKDRFAALATDAVRANLLELCGYQTHVMEFIDLEHTPKNLLIRAIRREIPASRLAESWQRYQNFVRLLGARTPYLADALRDLLPPDVGSAEASSP